MSKALSQLNFSKTLIDWQLKEGRHALPWQKNRTAYRVWLSEVMLQQTQVSTVLKRYDEFLQRFPSVEALAKASIDDVLAQWSGMGYYSRARRLHQCAQVVVQEYSGQFPSSWEELQRLPGIGKSTAAAILVFAFGKPAAIMDGNVKRVLARIWGITENLGQAKALAKAWEMAEELLPHGKKELVAYTQGLMDFGATACTVKQALCQQQKPCPFEQVCYAKAHDLVAQLPKKTRSVSVRQLTMHWEIHQWKGKVLLEKRPTQGIWAGMWCFPEGLKVNERKAAIKNLRTLEHVLSHRKLTIERKLYGHQIKPSDSQGKDNLQWFDLDTAMTLGIPKPVHITLLELSQVRGDV